MENGSKRNDHGAEYIPLMAEDDANGAEEHKSPMHTPYRPAPNSNKIVVISVYAALLVSLISFALSGLTFLASFRSNLSPLDVKTLKQPSLYLGLERVPTIREKLVAASLLASLKGSPAGHGHGQMHMPTATGSPSVDPIGPVTFRPTAILRISSLYPDSTFEDDGWISLTDTDSVILQFLVPANISSTSENSRCALTGSFPPRTVNGLHDRLLTIEPSSLASVEVWEVSAIPNTTAVSWNSKPSRLQRLGTMDIMYDSKRTIGSLPYSTGSTINLELGCVSDERRVGGANCRVEFQNTDSMPDLGFTLAPVRQ